jgi:hypothetical protein
LIVCYNLNSRTEFFYKFNFKRHLEKLSKYWLSKLILSALWMYRNFRLRRPYLIDRWRYFIFGYIPQGFLTSKNKIVPQFFRPRVSHCADLFLSGQKLENLSSCTAGRKRNINGVNTVACSAGSYCPGDCNEYACETGLYALDGSSTCSVCEAGKACTNSFSSNCGATQVR